MNVLIWIFLIVLVIIVAKYNYESWNAGTKVVTRKSKIEGLKVLYGGKVVPKGAAIPHTIAAGIPTVKYTDADDKKFYMLALVDPDSPSHMNPTLKEWRHWVVGNIPGKALKRGFTGSEGTTIETYGPPLPPGGTGYHRYYFKLYQQPRSMKLPDLKGTDRRRWKSSKFAHRHGMRKVDQTHFLTKREGAKGQGEKKKFYPYKHNKGKKWTSGKKQHHSSKKGYRPGR